MAKNKKEKADEPVELTKYRKQYVTAYPTAANKFHKQGEPFQIHPDQAEKLLAKGLLTFDAPETAGEEGEEK